MSDTAAYEGLAARVDQLERQSRRLKRQLFAALVGLLCLGTISATTAQQRSISFSGPKGSVRIDAMGIHFLTHGKERATLGYSKTYTTPSLRFTDAGGAERAYIGISSEDSALMQMYNTRGDKSVSLSGNGVLYFYDDSGTKRLYLGTTTTGNGIVEIYNTSGSLQSELASDFLRLGDGSGTEREYIGVTTTDEAVVKLWDRSHTERNFMGEFTDGVAGFASYNTSGTSTWSSP
jgi:hypothetical protein